jgi:hypothetical protein
MQNLEVGDTIAHNLMPAAVWSGPILETKPCETDSARPEEHLQYRVIDPGGSEDWLCAHDVQLVRKAPAGEGPVYPAPGSTIPDQPGFVVGECTHRVAGSEWRAGFTTCERC